MKGIPYKTIFHLFFGVFLLALPFSKGIASVSYVALLLLSVIGLLIEWKGKKKVLAISVSKEQIYPRAKEMLLPGILFLVLCFSLLYSQDKKEGLRVLMSQSKMVGIPFIILVNYFLIQRRYYSYIFVFIRGVVIACCLTLLFFLLPESFKQTIIGSTDLLKPYVFHEKKFAFGIYSPFIDRLQFSYLIGAAFFLEYWSSFQLGMQKKFIYAILNFHSITLFITLLLLGARGAQLGFIAGLGIWFMGIYWQYAQPIIKQKYGWGLSSAILVLGLVFTTIALPQLCYKTIPAVQMRYDQLLWEIGTYRDGTIQNYNYTYFSSIRRLFSWKHSWNLIKEQPILGTGIGDYQSAMKAAYTTEKLLVPVNTQSQYLYYWTSAGLFGISAFLASISYWLFSCLRRRKIWHTMIGASLFVFYFIIFLLDAPLNYQVGAMTFWLLYALVLMEEETLFSAKV